MTGQSCTLCVMDTSDPDIIFDAKGVCNYCRDANQKLPYYTFTEEKEKENIKELSTKIKSQRKGKYDSILGLSGGVDSSYVAYLAMEMELNPLCVHFDNGWNSNIAVKNIRKIIDITGFDLQTYVIDWPEFRDLQRAFFKAGVIDIEMLTDHAIFASLFRIRRDHNIKTVLSGTNYATEQSLPTSWAWPKMDLRNIKSIHRRFGNLKLKSYPTMSSFFWAIMRRFGIGGVFEEPLNKINYRKDNAIKVLTESFDWQYYGGKHYESVFTKFYQAYILPTKFGVDKRKMHFSDLIRNGEIEKEEVLLELEKPLYDPEELRRDKLFILKKLGFSEDEFDHLMSQKPKPHDFYPTDRSTMRILSTIGKSIFGSRK